MSAKIDFSTVLASSVHDMKNSLGMLLSSVEHILEEVKPANKEQAKQFQNLQYEASRINGELIQLLTLYRMDNNFLPVSVDEHYLVDILEDQIARNQMLIDSSGIEVTLDCSEDLAWYFDGDLISGVVHNVLVNCLRYTNQKIVVSAALDKNELVIGIHDDGPGYPDEMLAQPTRLVEHAEYSRGETHLGLYFAEQIAALHRRENRQGSIQLNNGEPLGGGSFVLRLP
jgi:signal transduction histidine kinase